MSEILSVAEQAAYDAETERLNAAKDARWRASHEYARFAHVVPGSITAAHSWEAGQERMRRHESAARHSTVVGIMTNGRSE